LIDGQSGNNLAELEQVRAARDTVAMVPRLLLVKRENPGAMRAGHLQVVLLFSPSEGNATAPQ
jgi:hypothetical protein